MVAASTYRWNVLVAYLDDAMVHIFCLWLALLPVGSTLTLPSVLERGWSAATSEWSAADVPGLTPRAFLANMALVYLVAGLYKFTSPMWRDGSAMHAALRMPIARAPAFWTLRWRTPLRLVTWTALIVEPLFPLIFMLPTGSALKWTLVAGALIFHLGIALTLRITYSNLAMMGVLPIALGPDLMRMEPPVAAPQATAAAGIGLPESVAVALVALILGMLVWEAANTGTRLRERYSSIGWDNPVRALLWAVGIFQSYRLFDWVDARNYHVRFEVKRVAAAEPAAGGTHAGPAAQPTLQAPETARPLDPDALFPQSMRHLLLQSYLIGNIWLRLSPEKLAEVRRSLLLRHARRYARAHPEAGTIEAAAVVQRVTADNLALNRGKRLPLMRFTCRGGEAFVRFPE